MAVVCVGNLAANNVDLTDIIPTGIVIDLWTSLYRLECHLPPFLVEY